MSVVRCPSVMSYPSVMKFLRVEMFEYSQNSAIRLWVQRNTSILDLHSADFGEVRVVV